ncbi:MAG: hypothetical protein WCO98_15925 [bacterium]
MKKLILLGLAAAICSAAMASTTLTGQTGLTVTPTAAVAPVDTLNFAVDYVDAGSNGLYPIRANYGVAENWEAGLNYQMNAAVTGVTGKWVTPVTPIEGKLAVGASIQSPAGSPFVYTVYGTMTREIPMNIADVNVNGTAVLACVAGPGSTEINPAIGVDATFAKAGNLNIAVDYIFRGSNYALKGSYDLGDGFGVQAGVTDIYGGGKIFLGGNYTYDLAK